MADYAATLLQHVPAPGGKDVIFDNDPARLVAKVVEALDKRYADFHVEDVNNNDGMEPGLVIPTLLKEGYDVIAIMMPLAGNKPPVIEIQNT